MTTTAPVTQKSSSPRGVSQPLKSCKKPEPKRHGPRRDTPVPNIPAADLNVTQAANRTVTPRPPIQPSKLEMKAKAPPKSAPKSKPAKEIPVNALASVRAKKVSPTRSAKSAAVDIDLTGLLLSALESKLRTECTVNGKVDDALVKRCKFLAIDCVTEQLVIEYLMLPDSKREEFAQKIARSLKSAATQKLPSGKESAAFELNFNLDRRDMLQSAGMEVPAAKDKEWEEFVKNKLGPSSCIETSRGLAEIRLRNPDTRQETIEGSRYLAKKLFNKLLPGKCKDVTKLGRYDHMAMAVRNFSAGQIEHYGPLDKNLVSLLVKTAKELLKADQSDPTVWTFALQVVADKFRDDHYEQS